MATKSRESSQMVTRFKEESDIPVFQLVAEYEGQDFQTVVRKDPAFFFWVRDQKLITPPLKASDVGPKEAQRIGSWNRQMRFDLLPFKQWVEEFYSFDLPTQTVTNLKTGQKYPGRQPSR